MAKHRVEIRPEKERWNVCCTGCSLNLVRMSSPEAATKQAIEYHRLCETKIDSINVRK